MFQDRDDILYDEIEAENEPKSNLKKMIVEHCLGNLQANISEFIPPELTLEIIAYYEETYLGAFDGNHDDARAEIEATLTHAQAFFFDGRLQTKITLKVGAKVFFISSKQTLVILRYEKLYHCLENTSASQGCCISGICCAIEMVPM